MHRSDGIAIVGAGIGGLTLALGLARAGIRPRVYEQAPALGEVGAGISLSPNAVKGLRYVGLKDSLEALADEPLVQRTRHYATGEILVDIDRRNTRTEYGAPYLQMHRADLHKLLCDELLAIDAHTIVLNKQLRGIDRSESDEYTLQFSDGSEVHASTVVGADGLKSTVRELVFEASAPEFSRYIAWRGLIPRDAYAQLDLPQGSAVFIAPGQIFVRYPIRHGALQNFVAFSTAEEWADEGWSQTGKTDLLRAMFEHFHSEVVDLLAAFPGQECHKWGLFARQPLRRWVRGRVTVLGDAAHPMLPWFGQGAATSIEDAVVLTRCLDESETTEEALQRYEAARMERVTVVHRESLLGGERLVGTDPYALARNPIRNEDTLGLMRYDPRTVSI